MFSGRRLTVLIIPEEGGSTHEYKFPRIFVWFAGLAGVVVLGLLALGLRAHLVSSRLADQVALLQQEKGVLEEQVTLIEELEVTLRRLEKSNWQLRQIASTAVGLEPPPPSPREAVVAEHYIPGVERLRWGRIRTVPSLWPVRGIATKPYDPGLGGVVIRAPLNSLVRASAAGRVVRVGYDEEMGHVIEVDHGNRISSVYGYIRTSLVKPGQYVHKGQPIALSGASGRASQPALLYGVQEDGQSRDPEGYHIWL